MKKLITALIIAACGLNSTIASTLEEDIIEFIKLYRNIECFYDTACKIYTKNNRDKQELHNFNDQISIAHEMRDSLKEYLRSHYKELSFRVLYVVLEPVGSRIGDVGCGDGVNYATLSAIQDLAGYSEVFHNRLTTLANKYPEVFRKDFLEKNDDLTPKEN